MKTLIKVLYIVGYYIFPFSKAIFEFYLEKMSHREQHHKKGSTIRVKNKSSIESRVN